MIKNHKLHDIETEIKDRLGEIVHKCGIVIILFTQSEEAHMDNVHVFGNIKGEERISLMTSLVVTHRVEQARAMAERMDEDTTVN